MLVFIEFPLYFVALITCDPAFGENAKIIENAHIKLDPGCSFLAVEANTTNPSHKCSATCIDRYLDFSTVPFEYACGAKPGGSDHNGAILQLVEPNRDGCVAGTLRND